MPTSRESSGRIIELDIERPVAGGRMLARGGSGVVLVAGAIPGERVRVEIERTGRGVSWGRVVDVIDASPDRRPVAIDPACGGLAYAHVVYERQLALKAEVIADTFRRVGRITLADRVDVTVSPVRGYRMRARLHLDGGRAGFFREATHDWCDARVTGQLREETLAAVDAGLAWLGPAAAACRAVIVAEDVTGGDRVLHLEADDDIVLDDAVGSPHDLPEGLAGVTMIRRGEVATIAGRERVTDTAATLMGADAPVPASTTWSRRAASFFQANRYLTGTLVRHVLEHVRGERVADVYAGVGLFAVALAASVKSVVAIEGDRTSAADLEENARPYADRVRAIQADVADAARWLTPDSFDVVIVDPPRSGLSDTARDVVIRAGASCVIYVSCDPATLARDTARFLAAGYEIASIRAFDFFPLTAHIETVVVLQRLARGT
ncbi:MAG TPA: RsmD family RNA methyltransferase [Vicinamibacterales bacterium]|nr:RsmD family RNA methyltransferase [Vicinamibacterales bacterium]